MALSHDYLGAEFDAAQNIPQAFLNISKKHPNSTVYQQGKNWESINYKDTSSKIFKLCNYLLNLGISNNDKVAIASFTRPEWLIADMAILNTGATSVAIYQSLNPNEIAYILHDSNSSIIFAENEEQVKKLLSLKDKKIRIPEIENRPACEIEIKLKKIITFEETSQDPSIININEILNDPSLSTSAPSEIDKISAKDLASIVYTSGTTGPPKGVMQTHANHLANLKQAAETKMFAPDGDIFLFLPLAHSFARLVAYIGFLTPTCLKFPAVANKKSSVLNVSSITEDIVQGGAQVIPTVPRILEKMQAGVIEQAQIKSIKGLLLKLTVNVARKNYSSPNLLSKILFTLTKSIRKQIKQKLFGKNFKHVVSGGAKLAIDVNEFFQALEIDIYQGYGLTETCVATNVNRIGKNKIGTVGPVLKEIEIKIASDGEICFRGPNVTQGYYNRPIATKESWDSEGWFHTGDLGELDNEGYLTITGRKKELIVTAGGKKIAPQPIEEKLQSSPYISNAIIYGDDKPYCIALIVLESSANENNIKEIINKEIEKVNSTLSRFETIKKFRILPEEFSIENGLLTPTLKVKKKAVFEKYHEIIEEAYR